MRDRYFNYDKTLDLNDLQYYHPAMLIIISTINSWCSTRGIIPYYTSFHRPFDAISQSKTHQEYRAVDLSLLSCFGWTPQLIKEFIEDMDESFGKLGAIVSSGNNRLIYPHGKKKAYHAHIQIRADIYSYWHLFLNNKFLMS